MYQYLILNNSIARYNEDPYIRQWISEILRLRFTAYRTYYGFRSIPTDLFDYIGTHLVITKSDPVQGSRKAVLAYRITTLKECDYYGQDFPYIGHMHAKNTDEEAHIIRLANDFISQTKNIGYINSYAVDPDLEQEEKQELIHRGLAFYAQYCEAHNSLPLITGVSDRFKVYRKFREIGFEYTTGDDIGSTFTAPHIMGEKFRSMVLTQQASYAQMLKQRYKSEYLNAEVIICREDNAENSYRKTG